jgi:superfamily II DNA or RNA helicase
MSALTRGSFEYLEAKIRGDATGTLFGRDFEWICRWYLEHAPLYRGKFRRVWRWADWPDRWGRDCGIDLIAETHDGKLWAVQAKAVAADHSITKAEIDSFLAESNRSQIAYRLLIATTDDLGSNARRTIAQQAKHVSFVGRGDLLNTDIVWPSKIGGTAPRPSRAKPRPHQRAAVAAVLRGFGRGDRGRLIMACGTGKTLTGLWIHERLKSRRTLLLVPSISLVQQNLREWGRHACEDFDCLVVCSDESVASDRDDPALRYIAELGIDVTTDPAEITAFLAKRRRRPAVVIATYQSSDRVSKGQRRARKAFDLALCDEAHRLVGDVRGKFATILDDRKIRCRRRLFMTATPRYFTQRAKDRAADQDLEVASMDDVETFGPEFHVLKFYDAITAKPTPLLTDYRVVVIGVTNAEAAAWVEEGKLVRTRDGAETDARTLAAQIGLAKAIREYDLRRIISFHRSIRRASRFVDPDQHDSLPAIAKRLRAAARPSGKLWARHISGETPASKRASMLRSLAELPDDTRGLVANCACLGEGVDVPALDGIAFIDPKGSTVDIIQAVGRVIRLSRNKTIGTIVIPVFIDESEDAEYALEQSAFDPVWQVLKALRAHDARLADELDALRTSVGSQRRGKLHLPANVVLDVPTLMLGDFEQAFYVRTIREATQKALLTIEGILMWADDHKAQTGEWPSQTSGAIPETEETWAGINHALDRGHRGLATQRYSLARLLEDYRGVRNRGSLPPLTEAIVLEYADKHFASHGSWPTKDSGVIEGTKDKWSGISIALRNGARGLRRKISLANLLWEKRGVPNKANRPKLTIAQILQWIDAHKKRTRQWPNQDSGKVEGTSETWRGINSALAKGMRGLKGGSSIVQLLVEQRGVKTRFWAESLTVADILSWCDCFFERQSRWPKSSDGEIPGTPYSWLTVDNKLRTGWAQHKRGSSLPQLLHEKRGYRHRHKLPPLTRKRIIALAKQHFRREGRWPTTESGEIPGTGETWQRINAALAQGQRGFPGGDSLPRFLHRELGVVHRLASARLSVRRVLEWVNEHKARFGTFPTIHDNRAPALGESWLAINAALERGSRGLPGGSSLPKLLAEHRGVTRGIHRPRLKLATIVGWARSHHKATGQWPTEGAGEIVGTDERWDNIAQCVRLGLRGCPAGWTLKKVIDKYCRKQAGRR